uniref:LRRCT domain-containing protein n=1 Tax=Strigamia maritima TaxID=126957 RepID=T1J716_STRMM
MKKKFPKRVNKMRSSIGMLILSGLVYLSWPVGCDIFGQLCPNSCVCNLPWFMNGAFVDCSARGLSLPPTKFPPNTVEIDLSGNNLNHVPYLRTLHRLRKLDIAHNRLEDDGVESISDQMCDLEELVLAKNQLSRFPFGLPQSLTHLDLSENVISSLTCTLLAGLPPVKNLVLSKNMFSVLTKDSFCPNFGTSPPLSAVLHNLDLSGNNIHVLEEGVFRCLTQLERLNLSGNLLSLVGPKEFKGLTTLKILDMSNNALLQIGEGSFNDMPRLYYLSLKQNQLTSVPRNLLPHINVLDVTSNAIAVISEDSSLLGIKHVLISHNPLICDCRIRWIRQHLVNSLPVTQHREDCPIDLPIPNESPPPRCANPPSLAGKPLAQVEDDKLICCLSRFPFGLPQSLTHLDLSENVISSLTCTLLAGLPPVKNLVLSKNMFSVLTKDSFCPNFGTSPPLSAVLHNLDLSGNNIHTLEEGVFRCLTQLEKLNLSGNILSLVGSKEFKGLTTLKILDMSNNALLQIGEGSFNDMPRLYYLNLKQNQLTSVPRNLLPHINVLDVTGNAIAVISEDSSLLGIKHVLISHNPLICDCRIRWIRQHLVNSLPVTQRREDCPIDLPIPNESPPPRCANPPSLAGKPLAQVEDDKLICC